jgi:hypothetical protein
MIQWGTNPRERLVLRSAAPAHNIVCQTDRSTLLYCSAHTAHLEPSKSRPPGHQHRPPPPKGWKWWAAKGEQCGLPTLPTSGHLSGQGGRLDRSGNPSCRITVSASGTFGTFVPFVPFVP